MLIRVKIRVSMSRIGKQVITIPSGVTVQLTDGLVRVTGPKGTIERTLASGVTILVEEGTVKVSVKNETEKKERALWGTFAAHIKHMIKGVTVGFQKQLEVNGVGYRVAPQGKDLKLELGFSHPVVFPIPQGIAVVVEKNIVTLSGSDKELLGNIAARIRALRPPEPYKGKGIKYVNEVIRRKAGKAATKTSAAA